MDASFFSKYGKEAEKTKIIFCEWDIGDFCENIDIILDNAYENIKFITGEPFDRSQESRDKICSLLKNICYKFDYEEPKDIIEFLSKIFLDILTMHFLKNRNKRLASTFLYNMLWAYGVFFKYSKKTDFFDNSEIYLKHEKKISEFVCMYQNSKNNGNDVLDEIYQWIFDNILIAFNFI